MQRLYDILLKNHFKDEDKMAFVSGPRQIGKTTSSRQALPHALYLNWDVSTHRELILQGPEKIFDSMGGNLLSDKKRSIIFDEIHKFPKWKGFLKGFFDLYHKSVHICVTGSARLNIFKHGGDSLMGRYFPFRMHPMSLRETLTPQPPKAIISDPIPPNNGLFDRLLKFGGFPEPFLRADIRFYNRWKRLRLEQLFKEDLRDLTHITDVLRVQTLAEMLSRQSGGMINYSNLSGDLQVSVDTIRRWIDTLESLFYCFRIRPYSKKIARSLIKEPKVYLWDWSLVADPGARNENFVASHLLKMAHYYTDAGFGNVELYYLRDKEKREVDFLITRDDIPWFIVEVKTKSSQLSESLHYFQNCLKIPHAFQTVFSMPFVNKSCFSENRPIIVPASTLLSQLV
jgi:hypothetical protein